MSQPVPIEDYESLGNTFLGGNRSYNPIITHVEVIDQDDGSPPIRWERLALPVFCLLFIACLAVAGVLAWHVLDGIQSTWAAAAAAPHPSASPTAANVNGKQAGAMSGLLALLFL